MTLTTTVVSTILPATHSTQTSEMSIISEGLLQSLLQQQGLFQLLKKKAEIVLWKL